MLTRQLGLCFGAAVLAALASCSASDSTAIQPGTPAWYWSAAEEAYALGDYEKTQQHLEQVVRGEGEQKAQAAVWRAAVVAGLSRGYMEAGDACEDAMEADESRRSQFQPRVQQYRRDARRYAVSFAESIGVLRGIGQDATPIRLEFPFPGGSANESPVLATIREGQAVSAEQLDSAVNYTLRRGLLLQTAALAGTGDDVAAAQSLFTSGPPEVARLAYLHGLAKSLFDISALFGSSQLNEPKIQKVLLESALSCLEPALAAEDEKAKEQAEKMKEEIDKQASRLKV